MAPTRFNTPYKVVSHEFFDDEFVRVNLRCLGYPTHGTQPEKWDFAIHVVKNELSNWSLGEIVRMTIAL